MEVLYVCDIGCISEALVRFSQIRSKFALMDLASVDVHKKMLVRKATQNATMSPHHYLLPCQTPASGACGVSLPPGRHTEHVTLTTDNHGS